MQNAEHRGFTVKMLEVDLAFPFGHPEPGDGQQFTLEQENKFTDDRLHGAD